jgi:FkbM family methyltransferase
LVQALRTTLTLPVFLESGTYRGDTASAAAALFEQVYTVELSSELYAQAEARFASLANVSRRLGDSPQVISELAPQLASQSVLYWLDAHWCGTVTGGKENECPLLSELRAIGTLNDQSVVLIDDARLFLAPPPKPHDSDHWPLLDEVVETLRGLNPHHRLWVINDVMVFAPPGVQAAMVEYSRTHGADLQQLVQAANAPRVAPAQAPVPAAVAGGAGLARGLNAEFLGAERSERIFAHHLQRLAIAKVLDIGSNSGQFAAKLRRFGFTGVIYCVEPQASAYAQLLANSREDARWFPLARQGAGSSCHFMDLNLSENSWSSSLREVHPNHVRAEASTRIVGTERIFVNTSGALLRAPAMMEIEALKIDVQGYEDEVIDGFLPHIGDVRLLLLELSLVECYQGAPDLFALDRKLVTQLGFSRVSLEPSYYDDGLGVVQQYDGIYFRPDRPGSVSARASGLKIGAVVTSVGGTLERRLPDGSDLGPAWFQMCLEAWQRTGSAVTSVAERSPPAGIEWVQTQTRPSVAEMLAARTLEPGSHLLLVNADIVFATAFFNLLGQLDPEGVYYGNRLEVERDAQSQSGLQAKGIYAHGFDYFLLPAAFAKSIVDEHLLPAELRIGEPWWDYALPLLAIARGFPLKRLPWNTPLALHYLHPARYSQDVWLRNGQLFIQLAESLLRDPQCYATGLLTEILADSGDLETRLRRIAGIICHSLP